MTTPSFNYDDWQERISAYINQQMSEIDRQAFEKSMAQITELQAAVALNTMLNRKAKSHFLAEYAKANWDDIINEKPSEEHNEKAEESPSKELDIQPSAQIPPLSIKGILGGIGIISIVFLAYFGYQYQSKQAKIATLTTKQKVWFPHVAFDSTTTLKDAAVQLYADSLYQQAEVLFLQNDAQNTTKDDAYTFYRAINALMLQPPNTDRGMNLLKQQLQYEERAFENTKAEWYLILAYLQKEDYTSAKKELEKIPNESKYYLDAQEVLKLLYTLNP